MAIAEVGGGTQRATIRSGAGVDSATGVFPANITSGNLLTLNFAGWSSTADTAVVVTDTRSTSWTTLLAATGIVWGAGVGKPAIAYGIASSSGACTVTVNPSGTGDYFNGVIDEWSGVDPAPLDVDGGESTGAGTTPSDSLTTATAGALVLGTLAGDSAVTITPDTGGGYTQLDEDETTARQPYNAEFKIVGAAGAQTVNWTFSSGSLWSAYTAAFRETQVSTDAGWSGWPIFRPKLWSY